MKDYQTLIADIRKEERELNDKLTNLEYFMMTEDFTRISPEQKKLLERQHDLMAQYKTVLIQRAHRINYEHVTFVQEPEKSTDEGADEEQNHVCTTCKWKSSKCGCSLPIVCKDYERWESK